MAPRKKKKEEEVVKETEVMQDIAEETDAPIMDEYTEGDGYDDDVEAVTLSPEDEAILQKKLDTLIGMAKKKKNVIEDDDIIKRIQGCKPSAYS